MTVQARLRPRRAARLPLFLPVALLLFPGSAATQDGTTDVAPPPARMAVAADSARLLAALEWLAHDDRGGRAPGTEGGLAARAFLVERFRAAGVRPFGEELPRPFPLGDGEGANVVGWLPGSDPATRDGPWIVVTAHYDHQGIRDGVVWNGADDNASGTVALLFLARRLAEHPSRHPVILAALDAEESGLRGARALVDNPPVPLDRMGVNLNLDMLARGSGTLWAAGAFHTPELGPVLDAVATQAPMSLRQGHDRPGVRGEQDWTGSSDHAPFHEAGIPFVYLGVEDHPDYHRPTDDFERVDPTDYLDAVATTLLVLEALDSALPLLPHRPQGAP